MSDLNSWVDPLPLLVRELSPVEEHGENFRLVKEDPLVLLAANIYMLRAVTKMWRRFAGQNPDQPFDVYSDGMLAYYVCQSITSLYSNESTDGSDFSDVLKAKNKNSLHFEVFYALRDYLDLLHSTGDISNDIWKRATSAMYAVCDTSDDCFEALESLAEKNDSSTNPHWAAELLDAFAEVNSEND